MDYKKIMERLGRDCADYRKSIGLTQDAFAMETGYAQGSISAFERGNSQSLRVFLLYVRKGYDVVRLRDMLKEV